MSLAAALLALPGLAAAEGPPHELEGPWVARYFPHGRLGVEVLPMTAELREHFGLDPDAGVLVSRVEADSPAARAGIEAGDVILSAGGTPMRSTGDLLRVVARVPAEEELVLELSSDGERRELRTELRGPSWMTPHESMRALGRAMADPVRELREQIRALEERLRALEEKLREQEI